MRFTVTKNAPADIYGKPVKEGDELSLSKAEAAHHLRKGHLVPAAKDSGPDLVDDQMVHLPEAETVTAEPMDSPSAKTPRGKRN